jgi:hypothetical protein
MQNRMTTATSLLTIFLLAASTVAQGPPRRTEYKSRCGSEIAWIESIDVAKAKASAENKPIFWFIPSADGSRMDRLQELYWYMMSGAFMDPALVSTINKSFIPLRLGFKGLFRRHEASWMKGSSRGGRKKLSDEYNIKHLQFIEPGFLILDSEGKSVAQMDRLTTYNSHWMMDRLKKATKQMPGVELLPAQGAPSLAGAHEALAKGDLRGALALFAKRAKKMPEAAYFEGVCLHMTQQTTKGDSAWRRLAKRSSENRWAWKAKIELDRWGPFINGFEEYRSYPQWAYQTPLNQNTQLPGTLERAPEMTARAIDVLLSLQRDNGGWTESRYDFGGVDGLPNVHVAVTALSAMALLEWESIAPKKIRNALDAADRFLWNEKNTNPDDNDELIWAHTYRLMYLSRLLQARPQKKARIVKKMAEITRLIVRLQGKRGDYAHEYPNPFATALTIHALNLARQAKVPVPKKVIARAAEAVERCRGEDGTYSYGAARRKGGGTMQGSAGRMPLCELALLIEGKSTQARLGAALAASFEHGHLQEAVRKYDDHADRWANGGFFFWFGIQMRAEALRTYNGDDREALRKQLRDLVLRIHEVDGSWIDSHEIGKSYGTAMGLITLKDVLDIKP